MNNEEFDIHLSSAKWSLEKTSQLLTEYENCKTEHSKIKILGKLKSMWYKMNYEGIKLDKIIKEAKNDEV